MNNRRDNSWQNLSPETFSSFSTSSNTDVEVTQAIKLSKSIYTLGLREAEEAFQVKSGAHSVNTSSLPGLSLVGGKHLTSMLLTTS